MISNDLNDLNALNDLKKILFLCTGNYYRSRFAEEYFNIKSSELGIAYLADSAALALERGNSNKGPISWHAIDALEARGLTPKNAMRYPKAVSISDLESACIIVAMCDCEHRPIVTERHPDWVDRIRYWNIDDVDVVEPSVALAKIERLVLALIAEIRSGNI